MKKIIFALMMTVAATGAFAMGPGHGGGGFHGGGFRGGRTVIVSGGFYSPFYSPWGYGWGWGGYPYYAAAPYRPSKLDLQVMDIKNDYSDRIASVKMDRDLSGKERRQEVRQLKRERDNAVYDAKRNYYKQAMERRSQPMQPAQPAQPAPSDTEQQ